MILSVERMKKKHIIGVLSKERIFVIIYKEEFWIHLIDFIKQFSQLISEEKEPTSPPQPPSL